jgi:dTDP-4-amino-4,6-dideoxy-D-galactose acyltransferase
MTSSLIERAARHSPMGFLRGRDEVLARELLQAGRAGEGQELFGTAHDLIVRALDWDTRYFGVPVYRIEFAGGPGGTIDAKAVADAIEEMRSAFLQRHAVSYVFAEVPSEDVGLLQGLGLASFRLLETRLAYVHHAPQRFLGQRAGARLATIDDIPALRHAGAAARNEYDRYHADPFFGAERADTYLADYIEACVRGLADTIVVPGDGGPASAFVAGNARVAKYGDDVIGRLLLAAVAPERRGAYRMLNGAFLGWMAERGATQVVNTTQSTNRAVIHVCEELGYKFGRASHVFAAVIGQGLQA